MFKFISGLGLSLSLITLASGVAYGSTPSLPSTTSWSDAGLQEMVRFSGPISVSVDGAGFAVSGTLQVSKPANATVIAAYLTSSVWASSSMEPEVTLAGTPVIFSHRANVHSVCPEPEVSRCFPFINHFADVTDIVKPVIDASASGIVDLAVTEVETDVSGITPIDGESLIVIFDDPAKPASTVIVMFGTSKTVGDSFTYSFPPITNPSTQIPTLHLGIGYSAQWGSDRTQQSDIKISTSSSTSLQAISLTAGGQDDGVLVDGSLLTVGGVGDSPALPGLSQSDEDDELYGLGGFLAVGDTSLTISTKNVSGDDNLFLSVLYFEGVSVTEVTSGGGDPDVDVPLTPVTPPTVVTPRSTPTPTPSSTPTPTPTPTEPSIDLSALLDPSILIPEINPGEPIANPAIGATGDDSSPPVPFDPLASAEGVVALTTSVAEVAAVAGALAAGAAAGAVAGNAGSGSPGGNSVGSRGAPSGQSQGGSITAINATHENYRNRRRNSRGDRWKIWNNRWLNFVDASSIWMTVKSARFSPVLSKIFVDGAYLRASLGSFSILPTLLGLLLSVSAVSINTTDVAPPQWQWFIAIAVIGIFDTFAGLLSTMVFVLGTIVMHGALSIEDIRLLLGVIIIGFGPALLANAFRAFRKEPGGTETYWWERIVDFAVIPFIGGWVTASMVGTLPALAGTTLAVANHINDFAFFVALAIMARVVLEEVVARTFPKRIDMLHPTIVDETDPIQKWISLAFRLSLFVFVTAALMGNVWQVWVGSALFILPTLIGFYSDRFKNFHMIWRILPTGIPGLAMTLLIASITTSLVGAWFGASPDLALWSFALLPIPMLILAVLGMFGREGLEGEVRWIKRPHLKWVYRIGGIVMLIVTMNLAGVI